MGFRRIPRPSTATPSNIDFTAFKNDVRGASAHTCFGGKVEENISAPVKRTREVPHRATRAAAPGRGAA